MSTIKHEIELWHHHTKETAASAGDAGWGCILMKLSAELKSIADDLDNSTEDAQPADKGPMQ